MKKILLLAVCLFLVIIEVVCQDVNKDKNFKVRLHKYVGTAAQYERNDLWNPRLVKANLAEVVFLEKDQLKSLASKINHPPDVVNIKLDGPYDSWCSNGAVVKNRVDTTWEKVWYLDSNWTYRERSYSKWSGGKIIHGDDNKDIIGGDQFTYQDGEYLFRLQIDLANGRIFHLGSEKNKEGSRWINFIGHDCTNRVSFNRWFNIGFKRKLLNHIKKGFVLAIK